MLFSCQWVSLSSLSSSYAGCQASLLMFQDRWFYISSTSFYSWLRGQSRQIGSSLPEERKFHKGSFSFLVVSLSYVLCYNKHISGYCVHLDRYTNVYGHVHFCVIDMFNILISEWIVFFSTFTTLHSLRI